MAAIGAHLDPNNRPSFLTQEIDQAFEAVENLGYQSSWGLYNGAYSYDLANIKDHELVGQIIKERPDQRVFNILDIGAGNFQWGKALAVWIHKNIGMNSDTPLQINIFNVRGEKSDDQLFELGICKVHNWGSFKVEEIGSELKKRGFELENQVDFITSRWSLIHLVDPIGTFVQTLNLLRPKSGVALLDGFNFQIEGEDFMPHEHLLQLMTETNALFLKYYDRSARGGDHYILRRKDDSSCRLPMHYLRVSILSEDPRRCVVGSNRLTHFKRDIPLPKVCGSYTERELQLIQADPMLEYEFFEKQYWGHPDLYQWLKENDLLSNPKKRCIPIKTTSE